MDNNLKPCPFCGSKNVTFYLESDIEGYVFTPQVYCEDCGGAMIGISEVLPQGSQSVDDYPLDEKEKIIKAWNRRD